MKYSLSALFSYVSLSCVLLSSTQLHASSLNDVYQLAIENDKTLQAAKATALGDKEVASIRKANLLPQIVGQASISRGDVNTNNSGQSLFGSTVVDNNRNNSSDLKSKEYSLSLQQALVDMSAWYDFKQGKTLASIADAEYAKAEQDLILRVASTYFNVLSALDQLKASVAEEEALKLQLKQTKQRYEVGLISVNDVHDAQAAYDSALANALGARGELGIRFDSLSVLTGQDHSSIAPLNQAFPVLQPEPLKREAWVEFAVKNNLEFKISQLAIDAAKLNTKARTSGHYPTLTGAISYSDNTTDTDVDSLSSGAKTDTKQISLNLNWPLYTGGRNSALKRQAYQQELASIDNNALNLRTITQNARALHLSVVTDVAQIKARAQAIVSNQSALDATQAGYDAGTRDVVDVVNAQRNLYQAQRDYAEALYGYIINTLELKSVAGTLNPTDIAGLEKWLDSSNLINRDEPL